MLPEHTPPLQPSDLARLDVFLQSAACGHDAMGLSYAHGFLTAVASGPERLEPAEWLRLMFDEPVFDTGSDAREMLGLALRLFGEIERGLRGETGFRPVVEYVRVSGGRTHSDARPWCRGFIAGFALFNEHWTRDAHATLKLPLSLISELSETRGVPDPAYARLCDALPAAAESIYHYWRKQAGQ
jgi:uncharacterized protein